MGLVKVSGCLSSSWGKVQRSCRRGVSQGKKQNKVAVITGASRGIGFATTKELYNRVGVRSSVYGITRGSGEVSKLTEELLTSQIRQPEVEGGKLEFKSLEVTDILTIVALRNQIYSQHGQIDILVNNLGAYFHPSQDPTEYYCQVHRTLDINYWGLKNVCTSFLPILSDTARVVNMSSNLGLLSLFPDSQVKEKLADPALTERELDGLMMDFTRSCTGFSEDSEAGLWPRCSYTVSKVAVNAYTGILQRQLQDRGREDIVVNSIHPGSSHSKISPQAPITASEAAVSVASLALLPHPCRQGGPRGGFLWHDLQQVDWTMETEDSLATGQPEGRAQL